MMFLVSPSLPFLATLTTAEAIRETFIGLHAEILSYGRKGGTTAVTAFIDYDTLWVANAGDSRAVLCVNGIARRVSVDHTPFVLDEQIRIEKEGGYVSNGISQSSLELLSLSDAQIVSRDGWPCRDLLVIAISHVTLFLIPTLKR